MRIAHQLHANATAPPACAALDRVVRDEPRHAALGWETLDWLLDTPTEAAVRDAIEQSLPVWVAGLRDSFAGPQVEPHLLNVLPHDLAWGLATPQTQRAIFEETLERDWLPRLARRDLQLL